MIELELSKKKSQFAKGPEGLLSGRKKNIMAFCTTLLHKVSKFHFCPKKYFFPKFIFEVLYKYI